MTAQNVLQRCSVEGNIVKLPEGQLDRKLYLEVAKSLELIGGKWKGGKVAGFVFSTDPTELLEQIASGETINMKKEYQFFPTPERLADELVSCATLSENARVLEPSAGQGSIVKAIHKLMPTKKVHGYEIMPTNQIFLRNLPGFVLLGEDFLTECTGEWDLQ